MQVATAFRTDRFSRKIFVCFDFFPAQGAGFHNDLGCRVSDKISPIPLSNEEGDWGLLFFRVCYLIFLMNSSIGNATRVRSCTDPREPSSTDIFMIALLSLASTMLTKS